MPPLRSREIEIENHDTFLLLKAAARAARNHSLSDAEEKRSALSDAKNSDPLSDASRKNGSLSDALSTEALSDALSETDSLSDASVAVSLSDPMPVIRRSALTKMGIISTPGRHLIFTHKGAKQICLVAK